MNNINFNEFTVVIPVKSTSIRVPEKNIRHFYGYSSLLDIKIKQMLEIFKPSQIYLCSDSDEFKIIAKKYGIYFMYEQGSDELTSHFNHMAKFIQTKYFIRSVVTMPYFITSHIKAAIQKFQDGSCNSLLIGERIQSHCVNHCLEPINFISLAKHKGSQDLLPIFNLKSLFIVNTDLAKNSKWQNIKPDLYELSLPYSLDINYPTDWELAKYFISILD